ncbi:hypothetical protein DNH61_01825 [Paenibacillus sambharensis]|uniref:histidine kinase n=2 Tax=Paenibacillus sambharensis TaxID=1803190 RepID=A0A2W1LSZ5_9BACL|nr:hypothetical protein DNH61_01825 [Paenibacillus sambharensis]
MWFRTFASECRNTIVQNWLAQLSDAYPGMTSPGRMRTHGLIMFGLICDIYKPLSHCERYSMLPGLCEYHADRGTPVECLLRSCLIWRRSFGAALEKWALGSGERNISKEEMWTALTIFHERIDELQSTMGRLYWNCVQEQLRRKDKAINRLYSDRMDMLGKMAASMAHELRNPLFAIEGFLKLIRSSLPPDELGKVERYIEVMESEFKGLYSQITGILSFSRNNALEEPFQSCRAEELLAGVCKLVSDRLKYGEVQLLVEGSLGFSLIVQRLALQQLVANLVYNSIEAFPAGSSGTDKIIRLSGGEDARHYYISVADNGPGIPAGLIASMFEPFVSGKPNGTGLGLSICKQIAEKNRCRLTYSASEGQTIFTLTFEKSEQAELENEADRSIG